jgi:Ni,Fe-hydrogenase maturation factor
MNSRLQTAAKPQTILLERALRHPVMETPTFLVIGHGDSLKSDGGVGLAVAHAVANWGVPHVQTIITQSSTMDPPSPELVDAIARAEYVIFVDACQGKSLYRPQITPIDCNVPRIYAGFNPTTPLAMVQARYGHHPQAWLLEVPAQDFTAGTELSPLAQQGLAQTLDRIAIFLRCYTPLRLAS